MLAKAKGPVTGESAEENAEPESPFASLDRPCLVYVTHPGAGGEEDTKLEELVFASEKVGLAAKAFRTVKITPEDIENDAILAGEGKAVPRLIVVNPAKEKVAVLEKGKLKAGTLFKAMSKASSACYKEKLDKVVKTHLKILTEQDQLSNEVKVLREKLARLKKEGDKAKVKLQKVEKELAAVEKEMKEVDQREKELWKLTRKWGPKA